MSRAIPNVGAQDTVKIFIESKSLSGDWLRVEGEFNEEHEFIEGEDALLGEDTPTFWQRYKSSSGTFKLSETNADSVDNVLDAIIDSSLAGRQLDIVIMRRTRNSDGTISSRKYEKCTLNANRGQGEKTMRDVTWKGTRVRKQA
jgi:hypothetical protein